MSINENVEITVRARGTGQARADIQSIGTASRSAASGVRLLTASFGGLSAALAAREIAQAADVVTNLTNKVNLNTKSAEESVAVQQQLFQIANETRAPIEGVATAYQRLAFNTRDLGASQADVLTVVKSLNQAVAISGATAEEAQATIIQLSQAFGAGVLRGDELRSVSEQLPIVLDLVAAKMGKTRGEVIALARDGKLLTKDVFGALLDAAPELNSRFGQVAPTIASTFVVLRNEFIETIGTLDKLVGGSTSLTSSLLGVAAGLSESLLTALAAVIEGMGGVVDEGADIVEVFEELGVSGAGLVGVLKTIGDIASAAFAILNGGISLVTASFAGFVALAVREGARFGVFSEADAASATAAAGLALENVTEDADTAVAKMSAIFENLDENFAGAISPENANAASERLRALGDDAAEVATKLRDAVAAGPGGTGVDLTQRGTPVVSTAAVDNTKELKKQAAELEKLNKLTAQLNEKDAARIDPLIKEVAAIDEKVRQTERLQLGAKDEPKRQALLARFAAARAAALDDFNRASAETVSLNAQIEEGIGRIATLDRDRAAVIQQALNDLIAEGGSVEELAAKMRDFLAGVQEDIKQLAPDFGQELGDGIADGAREGLRAALTGGDAFDAIEFFTERLADITLEQMNSVFEKISNTVEDLVSKAGSSIFGEGSGFGSGFGAALGLAGTLGLQALKGSSSEVSSDLVESAVTDAREVRGVVAGPTSIPIFQLGEELEKSLDGTNAILRQILGAVSARPPATATPVSVPPSSVASEMATTSPSLA